MDLVAASSESPPFFLRDGSEVSSRIAAYDWAQTPLGPIESWPQCLCNILGFMLASPVPLVLLWGEEGVMIYNDAYSVFAGGRNSRLLGSNVREGWEEISDFNDNVMRVGMSGGTLSYRNHELTLLRDGSPERVWMNLDYSPVLGDNGQPAGVIAVVVETSDAVQIRRTQEESEARLRFLDELGQAVVASPDAAEVLAITTRMTAQMLGSSNCAYADVHEDQDRLTVRGDWHAPGTPSIVGDYSLSRFGKLAMRELRAGRPLVLNDVVAELEAGAARSFQDLGILAVVCMPLIKDGRLTALVAVHDDAPREWTDHDLSLMREVADRSWAHIQRVGAEDALREREAYNRQILDGAIDYGIVATDLDGRVTLWNRGAAVMLGWSEAEMIGQPIATFFTPEDCALGRPETKRREALEQGRAHDARWHLRKSGERFWGLSEMTPLRDARGEVIGLVKLMRDRTAEYEAQEALQLSEERLRRAQAAGGVGLFSIDITSNTISATEEFCRIFGFETRAEISADDVERLVVAEDKRLVSDRKTRGSGSALLDIEYRIHRADTGEERTIARRADYEFNAEGERTRLVGVVQDVTDRLRIQRALEKSEAQFSALAQNMPNHVWTARADGWFDWFNDQVYAYSGADRGSLTGSRWIELVHSEDLARTLAGWSASLATGDTFEVENRLRDAHGRYRWHLTRAQPLTDARGTITAWVGTNTEIEAQKQAEVESVQDRERLWKSSQDLMLVCNLDGLITAVNPSAERMLGWTEAEMLGQFLSAFLHPDDLEATASEMDLLNHGATTFAFENRYRTKDGSYRLIAWTAVPANGRIHAIGRDITDQREVEEALRQSQKMEAVGQLTGGIAHDFNNLLQGITGSLDIMQTRLSRGRTDDLAKWLEGARGSAERAAALIHRLLAFSRRQPLDPRPVQSNPLIASMEDLLQRTLGESITLNLALADDLWLTRCDPNQLESAILNLAINARDAMPDGGHLTIATANARLDNPAAAQQREVRPGHYICVSVTDTGTGMARETIARAFEPFFTTKPTGQGTGLGLSMIYGFARQSGGHAVIESVLNQGTSIKLYLPRYRGADLTQDLGSELEGALSTDAGEVVLVVEDEAVVRGLIVEVLRELGYQAIEAGGGPEGLAILQGPGRIDLLVTDIGLPGLNGRQVADGARMVRPDLKVLFMTGYAENAALASGFEEPGMALITKPFAMDVLANKIREIIES
jgi:PAS domain S-box-containing protein